MDYIKTYKEFLSKFKEENPVLIESIENGFNAIFEEEGLENKDHRIAITFEIISDESASEGDVEERGWENEEGISIEPDEYDINEYAYEHFKVELEKHSPNKVDFIKSSSYNGVLAKSTVDYLRGEGATEPSSTRFHDNVWYTAYGTRDMHTGKFENRSFHLKNYTPEQQELIFREMIQ